MIKENKVLTMWAFWMHSNMYFMLKLEAQLKFNNLLYVTKSTFVRIRDNKTVPYALQPCGLQDQIISYGSNQIYLFLFSCYLQNITQHPFTWYGLLVIRFVGWNC